MQDVVHVIEKRRKLENNAAQKNGRAHSGMYIWIVGPVIYQLFESVFLSWKFPSYSNENKFV